MPADFSSLDTDIAALVAQTAKTVGTDASAAAVIRAIGQTISDAVVAALEADNAVDATKIAEIKTLIADVTKQYADASDDLGAAIATNPGTAPVTTTSKR